MFSRRKFFGAIAAINAAIIVARCGSFPTSNIASELNGPYGPRNPYWPRPYGGGYWPRPYGGYWPTRRPYGGYWPRRYGGSLGINTGNKIENDSSEIYGLTSRWFESLVN